MSSIIHLLPPIYPIFTGSTMVLNTDPSLIRIWIHSTVRCTVYLLMLSPAVQSTWAIFTPGRPEQQDGTLSSNYPKLLNTVPMNSKALVPALPIGSSSLKLICEAYSTLLLKLRFLSTLFQTCLHISAPATYCKFLK